MGKKREITDIFDANCKRTGKTLVRGEKPKEGEYPGGGSRTGEEPIETLRRELEEETGIVVCSHQATFLRQVYYDKFHLLMQVFLVESNAKLEDLKLQEEEVCDAMFVNHRELAQLYSHMTDIDKQIYTEAVSPMLLDGLQ